MDRIFSGQMKTYTIRGYTIRANGSDLFWPNEDLHYSGLHYSEICLDSPDPNDRNPIFFRGAFGAVCLFLPGLEQKPLDSWIFLIPVT